jgi:hypothetical protein
LVDHRRRVPRRSNRRRRGRGGSTFPQTEERAERESCSTVSARYVVENLIGKTISGARDLDTFPESFAIDFADGTSVVVAGEYDEGVVLS